MTDGTTTAASTKNEKTASLRRYRVMAYITGVFLLILVVEMFVKYVVSRVPGAALVEWIPYARLDLRPYLVTVVDLWGKVRWGFGASPRSCSRACRPVLRRRAKVPPWSPKLSDAARSSRASRRRRVPQSPSALRAHYLGDRNLCSTTGQHRPVSSSTTAPSTPSSSLVACARPGCTPRSCATWSADDPREGPRAVILSGGPASVFEQGAPRSMPLFDAGVPCSASATGSRRWRTRSARRSTPPRRASTATRAWRSTARVTCSPARPLSRT